MKKHLTIPVALLVPQLAHAALIGHYDFDTVGDNAGVKFTNEVTNGGTVIANAGSRATFDQNCRRLGVGSLVLKNSTGTLTNGADGAVSSNTFNWGASDVRTVAFWVKAGPTQTPATNPTMISLGSGFGTGNRFDIRLTGANLRLELQGGGFTTTSPLTDDKWHHVAIVVPNVVSTLADVKYYIDGTLIGNMTGTTAIATGTGPLRMGDSYHDNTRDFTGALDDVRLYDEALNDAAVGSLYTNGVTNIPAILCLAASTTQIDPGQSSDLTWEVDPAATSATIDNGIGDVFLIDPDGSASVSVSPTTTTTYTLTVDRSGSMTQQQVTVNASNVLGTPAITVSRGLIASGESVNLNIAFDITADTAALGTPEGTVDLKALDAGDAVPGDGKVAVSSSPSATFIYQVDLTKAGNTPTSATAQVKVFTFTPPADNAFTAAIKADSPLFYYRFEEAAAAGYLFDSSANGLHTDDIIGSLGQGSGPGGMQLAGAFPSNVGIKVPGARDMSKSVTLCAVVNSTNVQRTGASPEQMFFAMTDGTGTGRAIFYFGGGFMRSFITGVTSEGATVLPDNTSCLLHMVYDADTGDGTDTPEIRFYINGTLDATIPATAVGANIGNWILGSNKARSGQFLDGWLDETAAFETVLTDTQIAAQSTAFFAAADPLLGFDSDTLVVASGGSVNLTRKTSDQATAVTLNGNPVDGSVAGGAYSMVVNPTATTTYTLVVSGPGGPYTRVFEVEVTGAPSISSISYNGGSVTIEVLGAPNGTYDIKASSTLADGFPGLVQSITLDEAGYGITTFEGLGTKEFYRLEY